MMRVVWVTAVSVQDTIVVCYLGLHVCMSECVIECMCVREEIIVDHEIFAVKIFSLTTFSNEIKHAKYFVQCILT